MLILYLKGKLSQLAKLLLILLNLVTMQWSIVKACIIDMIGAMRELCNEDMQHICRKYQAWTTMHGAAAQT